MLSKRYIFYAPISLMAFLAVPQVLQWSSQSSDNYSRHLTQSDADKHLSLKPVDEAGFTKYVRKAFSAIGIGASSKPAEQVELVQLVRGQLGNSLHIIAMGYIVKFFAENMDPPVDVNIHYHTSNNLVSRVVDTKDDIKTCFSNFENADFYEFDDIEKQMILATNMYGGNNHIGVGVRNEQDFGKMMKEKIQFISEKEYLEFQKKTQNEVVDYFEETVPYLQSSVFAPPYLIDRYYDRLRKVFKFNDHCCKEKPGPDETVVHIRGFNKEIQRYEPRIKNGYEEIGPTQMAQNMLGHLTAGNKVALVAPSPEIAEPYKAALEVRGIKVRIVSQNRVQDFCFLMNAQKGLYGQHNSTYVFWAAILSKTVRFVSLYYVKNPLHTDGIHHHHEWTNPRLKKLFHYPVYRSRVHNHQNYLNGFQ